MGIATSDGKYYEDEMELLRDSVQTPSVSPLEGRTDVSMDGVVPTPTPETSSDQTGLNDLSSMTQAVDKTTPEPRYQMWPERMIRETADKLLQGGTKFGDAVAGKRPMTRDEMVEFATEFTGLMGAKGVTAPAEGIGIFGGVSGAARSQGRQAIKPLKDAADMIEKGADPQEIFTKTGWWRDPVDGQFKFEISDKGAKIDTSTLNAIQEGAQLNLGDFLGHAKLFEAYPEAKSIKVVYNPELAKENVRAQIWTGGNRPSKLELGPDFFKGSKEQQTSTLLHELQHHIQTKEGFATGGSAKPQIPEELIRLTETADSRYRELFNKGWSNLTDFEKKEMVLAFAATQEGYDFIAKKNQEAFKAYRAIPGEVEARNVQSRFMTPGLERVLPTRTADPN